MVDNFVFEDPDKPRPDRRTPLESIEPFECGDKRVLYEIFGNNAL